MACYKRGITQKKQAQNIKMLMIGNSFSINAVDMLSHIAQSAGVHVTAGVIYDAGQTLQGHWDKIQANETVEYFDEWSTETGYVREGRVTHDYCITKRDWNIITYQQRSSDSEDYTTFQPYLTNLHNHVQNTATNPDVEYGLHLTWARATPTTGTSEEMYNNIVTAYQSAMEEMDFDILLPTGTAIESARSNTYLEAVNDRLTRDNAHLDEGIGYYIAALTVFESLYSKDVLNDVSFYPTSNGATKFLSHLSRVTAKNAVLNPYKITNIG